MGDSPETSVPLVIGDPEEGPASFTRFLLPFCWSERVPLKYTEAPLSNFQDRSHYFTPETSHVLYTRARWLRLAGDNEEIELDLGGKPITATMPPPRLVLFEGAARPDPLLATGFLVLELNFRTPVTLDELMVINEMFRYWRPPFNGHASAERALPGIGRVTYQSFAGKTGNPAYLSRWIERAIRPLVAKDAMDEANEWSKSAKGNTGWIAQTDERAFVWTCALTEKGAHGDAEQRAWIRLLNVDLPSSDPVTAFEEQWAGPRTYDRWKHMGTLYGFNSHGGAMLGQPCDKPPTWRHFREIYFDQILLLLYLRASTFRFSRRLSVISEHLQKPKSGQGFREFRDLRRSFAFLTNLYRFPLLSSQQQGIEMYSCARKALDIDELFEEVQEEIESTDELYDMNAAANVARTTTILTYVATWAAIVGVILGTEAKKPVIDYLRHLPFLEPEWILILGTAILMALHYLFERRR